MQVKFPVREYHRCLNRDFSISAEPGVWQAVLLGGVSVASTYVFVAAGPPLVISLWGYPPSIYGFIAIIPTGLMAVAALARRRQWRRSIDCSAQHPHDPH